MVEGGRSDWTSGRSINFKIENFEQALSIIRDKRDIEITCLKERRNISSPVR